MAIPQSISERFWSKVDRRGPGECWPWRAAHSHQHDGRGVFYIKANGRETRVVAPRVAWMLTHGELPPRGVFVCHSCDNPPCCNPAHLWLGTSRDNTLDSMAKGRLKWFVRDIGTIRKCYRCAREMELEHFTKSKNAPGGRKYLCRQCNRAQLDALHARHWGEAST
jgi:hypothetical protein